MTFLGTREGIQAARHTVRARRAYAGHHLLAALLLCIPMLASCLLSAAFLKKMGQKCYEINISQDYVGGVWGTHGREEKCL